MLGWTSQALVKIAYIEPTASTEWSWNWDHSMLLRVSHFCMTDLAGSSVGSTWATIVLDGFIILFEILDDCLLPTPSPLPLWEFKASKTWGKSCHFHWTTENANSIWHQQCCHLVWSCYSMVFSLHMAFLFQGYSKNRLYKQRSQFTRLWK